MEKGITTNDPFDPGIGQWDDTPLYHAEVGEPPPVFHADKTAENFTTALVSGSRNQWVTHSLVSTPSIAPCSILSQTCRLCPIQIDGEVDGHACNYRKTDGHALAYISTCWTKTPVMLDGHACNYKEADSSWAKTAVIHALTYVAWHYIKKHKEMNTGTDDHEHVLNYVKKQKAMTNDVGEDCHELQHHNMDDICVPQFVKNVEMPKNREMSKNREMPKN